MSRRLKQAAVVFVVVFAAAQLVRPERTNPPTDVNRTIQAHVGTASGLAAVLDRACRDCHTNATVWPGYTQVAPLSWLMAYGVTEGRKTVNFSEWAAYTPEQQRSCWPRRARTRRGQDARALHAAASRNAALGPGHRDDLRGRASGRNATRRCSSGEAMNTTTLETKMHDFLAQKRIAVAGVSRDNSHHPVGNLIYRRLKTTGHDVFAVNPHMQTFEGDRCYPDLQSIPGGVDGVVIVTRPETTERIVRDCSDAGVRRVWMHQSMGKGSSVSPEAVEYCHQHDISVIAGACPMMYGPGVDFGHTCMRWILRLTGGLPA